MLSTQSELCRLCGFQSCELKTIQTNVARQIETVFRVNINTEGKLPKGICQTCSSSVEYCWKFYRQVHRVQHELASIRLCVKEETLSDVDEIETLETCVKQRKSTRRKGRTDRIIKDCPSNLLKEKKVELVSSSNDDDEIIVKKKKRKPPKCSNESDKNGNLDPEETWSEYLWRCLTCRENFNDVGSYNKHPCFKKHKRYFCVDCSKAFIIYNRLIKHIKDFHWERLKIHLLCQCDVCERSFRCTAEQAVHREKEHPDAEPRREAQMPAYYSFTCEVCGKVYANRKTLGQHVLYVHSDKLYHICGTCGERFQFSAGLFDHRSRCHEEEMLHCDQCGKKFPTKTLLRSHMVSHSNDRPFGCDICPKTFKTEYMAKVHKSRHTDNKKPHICDTCGKGFKCRTNLLGHRYLHKKERNHKCLFCEKAFKTKTQLKTHERQHTGEQPYSCSICDKKFTCYGNRNKHMRRIHKMYLPHQNDVVEDKTKDEGDNIMLLTPVIY